MVFLSITVGTGTASGPADVDVADLDGNGTVEDPYEISNVSELQAINDSANLGANYTLVSDINASGTDSWNGGKGFDPIGTCDYDLASDSCTAEPFDGSFDGAGYTISNLTINRTTEEVGLFGGTDRAVIRDVRLTIDGAVKGSDSVGGLVGQSTDSTITGSNVSGTVNGSTDVGGLVGDLYQGQITASTASGDVDGTGINPQGDTNAGGLVGYLYSSDLRTSNASGDVNGTSNNVGGLAGQSFNSTITGANARGDVNGTSNTGGLVGYAYDGKRIENSSATGAVDGSNNVGGLVGVVGGTDISRSYATGVVDGANSVGGLIGSTYGTHDLSELYATGSVEGTSNVGGLIGYNDGFNSRVERSYAAGTVTATARPGIAGGLVGYNRGPVANTSANGTVTGRIAGGLVGSNEGPISNSIATGTVDSIGATGQAGGLVAINFGTAVDAYWDINATNQSTSTGGTRLTTQDMTGRNATETMDGFIFTDTWHATDEYPVLAWRNTDPFYAVSIDGTNEPVTEGDTLDVTANVTNWGADGKQTVTLSDFDGTQQDATSVSLASGTSDDSVDLSWTTTTGDAGTDTVTVASENETAAETVTVDSAPSPSPSPPSDPPADDIDATVTADGAVANGSDEVTFTVDVEDDSNDPVSGTTISVDAAGDVGALGGLHSGDTAETNTSGAATFTATATDTGEFTVQFSEPDAGSASATATFEAGHPDDLTVDRVDDTAVANGTDTLRFAVTLEDAYDNRVPNATVRTTDTGTDILYGGDDSQETDANGELTVTAASTTAQANVTFTVEEQAQGIAETVTGTFEAGAPDSISADSTVDNATANGSDEVEFTVGVEDENNNPVEGATIEVDDAENVDALDGIDGNRTEPTNATGEAVFTAISTDIGEFAVRFSETTAGSDSATVTFEAGEPESIDAAVTRNRAIADGSDEVEFTVGVEDENNNPVEGATIEVDDTEDIEELTGIASGETETTTAAGEARFTASAADGGKYAVQFSETDAGTDTATATFERSADESTSTSRSTSSCTVSESSSIVTARSSPDRLRATVVPTISDGVAESRLRICGSETAEFAFPETESAYANLSTATIERIEFEFTEPVDTTLTVRTSGEPLTENARRLDRPSVESAGYLRIDGDPEHDRVDEALIEFRLPVEAVETADDPEAVSLYRSNPGTGDWKRVETTVTDSTDGRVRFGATVENVSQFAIGLDRPETETEPVDETDDEGVGETENTPWLLLIGLLLIAGLALLLWSSADAEESDEETPDGDVDGEERTEIGTGGQ